jgi:hypothetical protein
MIKPLLQRLKEIHIELTHNAILKNCRTYELICLVSKARVTVKWRKLHKSYQMIERGYLLLRVSVRTSLYPFRDRRQCVAQDTCHSYLKSCQERGDCCGRNCVNMFVQVSPWHNWSDLDPVTEEAKSSMSNPYSSSGYLSHNALQFCLAETSTTTSHIEAQLQVAPVEKFSKSHIVVDG